MSNKDNREQYSVFTDPAELTRRFRVAVREALRDHKLAGNPIAVWRNGKVVIVPPEEITWSDDEYGNAPPEKSLKGK
jgi:hypothetical protein